MDGRKQPPSSGALPDKAPQQLSKSVSDRTIVTSSAVGDDCILFGRGKACNNHPANTRMRVVINRHRDDYQAAGRGEKKLVVLKVHKELVEEGLRFLKQEKGIDGWFEADADEAIAKVGHAIRCNRRGKSKTEQDSGDKPQAAHMFLPAAVGPEALVPGQVFSDNSMRVPREDLATSLVLASAALAASGTRFVSPDALRHQQMLESMLSIGSNPLLALERRPIDLTALRSPLSASMPFAQQPPLSSTALNGLSAAEIRVLIERERQLQQAMMYEQLLRNPKQL